MATLPQLLLGRCTGDVSGWGLVTLLGLCWGRAGVAEIALSFARLCVHTSELNGTHREVGEARARRSLRPKLNRWARKRFK